MKPIIGIGCRYIIEGREDWRPERQGVVDMAITTIIRAGGVPILLPIAPDEDVLRQAYELTDAIMLMGGGDVHPRFYNQAPTTKLDRIDVRQDATELRLAKWASTDAKPILAICRGMQVLNVALGGTLIQDIPTSVNTTIDHNQSFKHRRFEELVHDVAFTPGSAVAEIVGCNTIAVNTMHHQSIDTVGEGLTVTGRSEDGVVEAIEGKGEGYIIGIQAHPEVLAEHDDRWQRLFGSLIDAAVKAHISQGATV